MIQVKVQAAGDCFAAEMDAEFDGVAVRDPKSGTVLPADQVTVTHFGQELTPECLAHQIEDGHAACDCRDRPARFDGQKFTDESYSREQAIRAAGYDTWPTLTR